MERTGADVARLEALFDEHGIRGVEPRPVTAADGAAADAVIDACNQFREHADLLEAYIYATTSTDSYDERAAGADGASSRCATLRARPLVARLADWVASLGVDELADGEPAGGRAPRPAARSSPRAPSTR